MFVINSFWPFPKEHLKLVLNFILQLLVYVHITIHRCVAYKVFWVFACLCSSYFIFSSQTVGIWSLSVISSYLIYLTFNLFSELPNFLHHALFIFTVQQTYYVGGTWNQCCKHLTFGATFFSLLWSAAIWFSILIHYPHFAQTSR